MWTTENRQRCNPVPSPFDHSLPAGLTLQNATAKHGLASATGATRPMTVRGFLAWYLATVALVSVSGAGAWHGIQSHKHLDNAAVVQPPASETSPPTPQVADAKPMQLAASDQVEATPPKRHPPESNTAPLPLPPLHVPMQSGNKTQIASGAAQPWIASPRPRPAPKVTARASTHRYPQTVVVQRAAVYPNYGPRSYVLAYPTSVAPWEVRRYAYSYAPYGYYPRYRYYFYPAD
jgi:hypothetical protein